MRSGGRRPVQQGPRNPGNVTVTRRLRYVHDHGLLVPRRSTACAKSVGSSVWPYAHTMEWRRDDGHRVTDDPQLRDLSRIHRWLSEQSYWATGRSLEAVRRSVEGSITL